MSQIMRREYPDAPVAAVGAVIVVHSKVLLIKRGHPPFLGEWSIPGGAVELGETICEAVVREAQEETGLVIQPTLLLGIFDRIIRDDSARVTYHYVLADYLCTVISGDWAAASDCLEARWFSPEELRTISLPATIEQVIMAGFEHIRQ